MDIKQRIKETEAKMQEIVQEYNAINNKQQELLKETLRLEGELKVLNELAKEER